jgi:hypothetical protein
MIGLMLTIPRLVGTLIADLFKSRCRLEGENLLLRHQLDIALRRAPPRHRLRGIDRALLVWMTRLWPSLLGSIVVVKPETVLRWHRAGFKAFWRWKSHGRAGRYGMTLSTVSNKTWPNVEETLNSWNRAKCSIASAGGPSERRFSDF